MRLWITLLVLAAALMIVVIAAGVTALNQDVPPPVEIKDVHKTSEPVKQPDDCRCDELPTPILPSIEDLPGSVAA